MRTSVPFTQTSRPPGDEIAFSQRGHFIFSNSLVRLAWPVNERELVYQARYRATQEWRNPVYPLITPFAGN